MTFTEWIQKRGVLYALTQTPILALLVGFFLKLAPYPVMMFAVLFSFLSLPIWISYRKRVSNDPDEPVHHLHKYALWALVPFTLFSLVRIPTHYLFGMAYWHPWYDFGSALTGQPGNQFGSLLPGAALYSLQGYSLTLGFYILFRSHSLLNAFLYICVFDTSIYSFIFPAFARVGMPSPPRWHAVAWAAHAAMATATWAMPKFWEGSWPKLGMGSRGLSLFIVSLVVGVPYAFPFFRAIVWQFPLQHRIDQATFDRPNLIQLGEQPKLAKVGQDAEYSFQLSFGPRIYKNYVGRMRTLDAKDFQVKGRIKHLGQTIAWCRAYHPGIPGQTRSEENARSYFEELHKSDRVNLPITCIGPKEFAHDRISNNHLYTLEWEATVHLIGDREEAVRSYASDREQLVASNRSTNKE